MEGGGQGDWGPSMRGRAGDRGPSMEGGGPGDWGHSVGRAGGQGTLYGGGSVGGIGKEGQVPRDSAPSTVVP